MKPGEKNRVTIELPKKAFAFYDVESKSFVVEPGEFTIYIGSASDACEQKVNVTLN